MIGQTLSHFEITAQLGAGGMGEVYRAADVRLGRDVAIKVLPDGFASNSAFRQRFEREARVVSSLNHPHICTLYDIGREGDYHYLVMELIEGESLADRLKRGPLPPSDVLRIGGQIASALDAAHRQHVIHRDLKPANVMLTRSGAKLLDFGLAKTVEDAPAPLGGSSNLSTEEQPLTAEGTILGTFQYMAPEQLEGLEADARTDIFALGSLLYEMATGRRAFDGDSKTGLIASIVSSDPEPISRIVSLAPPALDHVVSRCLAKDPEDRWQSARDIASELDWIGSDGAETGTALSSPPRRRGREWWAWGLAAAAVLGWVASSRNREPVAILQPPSSLALSITPPEDGTIEAGDLVGWGVVSPDGTRVAFPASTPRGGGLWIREFDRKEPVLLPGTEGAFYPFWSPDSRWLAFFQDGFLLKVEVRGGLPERVGRAGNARGGSWGDDGWILMTPTEDGNLHRVRAEGGEPSPVTRLDPEGAETAHYWPQLLPGGRSYLYFVRSTRADLEGIYLGTLNDEGREGTRRRLVTSSSSGFFVPDARGGSTGHLLWARDGRLVARSFDAEHGAVSGDAIDLGIPVRVLSSHRGTCASASSGGVLVSLDPEADLGHVRWIDRSGAGPFAIPQPEEGLSFYVQSSRDGESLIFQRILGGKSDLWMHDLSSGRTYPLTSGDDFEGSPVWSPDSERIAFGSGYSNASLHTLDLVRNQREEILRQPGSFDLWSWTTSDWVVGQLSTATGAHLAAVDLNRPSSMAPLSGWNGTALHNFSGDVSPDGTWMAWVEGSGTGRVALVAPLTDHDESLTLGASPQSLPVESPTAVRWSGAGDEIFVLSHGRVMLTLGVAADGSRLDLGAPEELFRLPSLPFAGIFSVSPDGQRFYLTSEAGAVTRTLSVLVGWRERLEGNRDD